MNWFEKKLTRLIEGVRKDAAHAKKLIVPVSGGSDGALTLWICHKAFPRRTIGIHAGGEIRCSEWFQSIGPIEYISTPGPYGAPEENNWARFLVRSLELKGWLVSSRNRTEDELGTYSLASRAATYLPIVNVWKSEVMQLCRQINVPDTIRHSSYKPDPDCGRPARLAAIPFCIIEAFLRRHKKPLKGDKELLRNLSRLDDDYLFDMVLRNYFKRDLPIRGRRP